MLAARHDDDDDYYHYDYYNTPCELFTLSLFHVSLRDIKSLQFSRTFLSIIANLNSAVFWMILILPLISRFSGLFSCFFFPGHQR